MTQSFVPILMLLVFSLVLAADPSNHRVRYYLGLAYAKVGNDDLAVQNLEVIGIDQERGLILVKGAVPGARGGYVRVTDATKRALPQEAPYPAGVVTTGAPIAAADNGAEAAGAEPAGAEAAGQPGSAE